MRKLAQVGVGVGAEAKPVMLRPEVRFSGGSLHSFPLQLNVSSSVHRITQLNT
jgi:hypothetical protein